MSTPSIQTLITQAQQVLNLKSSNEIRATLAAVLANANVGTPLNPNLTTQQLWDEFYEIVRQPSDDIMSIITDQMMRMVFSPPAPGGAGADKQVIFNDGGVLSGDTKFLWDKNANRLDVDGPVVITGDLTVDTNVLKVDTTNNRVGILTASPRSPFALDVLGNVALGDSTTPTSVRLKLDCQGTVGNVALMSFATAGTNKVFFGLSGAFAGDTSTDALIATDTAGAGIRFYVADTGAEAMRLNSTGNLVLKGGTVGANGVGVTFPATPVASSDANCLDDYEEGVWSPTVTGEVNLTSTTFVSARYTKIGRVVTVSGSVTTFIITSNTLAYFALQNLPFTAATVAPGSLWNDTRNTSGTTQVSGNILYGFLSAASGTTSGTVMTLSFSNTYTV